MMRRLSIAALVLMSLTIGGGVFAWQQLELAMHEPLVLDEEYQLQVSAGSSVHRVLDEMAGSDLIADTFWPRLFVKLNPDTADIKAGSYTVPVGSTLADVLALLVAGQADLERITLIEGWSVAQALQALVAHPGIVDDLGVELDTRADGVAWLSSGEHQRLATQLGIDQPFLEGWLFPDTYQFVAGTPLSTLLKLAHDKMRQHLERTWVARAENLPLTEPYALLILASIVEKETGIDSERGTIAGVFTRRLDQGMRLQTDPTVIYGIGKAYDGDIRRKDLQAATDYNTYVVDALPPTPIALPGLASLRAAAQPEQGNVLFFVASGDGDGTHVFSATNAEHEQAVAAYLKKIGR
ncbi:MAG: endolytic transglycosylase MltG [Pseudomonadota bacterium]